ncbi:phosphoglycerate dehydrogenase [Ruegeria atlantica]|uniref:phosphoglycerate dehydrogenase n=1 Tax=Ruegeria atlantica TaxID=81569 RepID=UPI00147F2A12|nr:phosphoglycerate dehydrogenase [Ruegeria atlantica]
MTSKIAITPRSLSGGGHPALSMLTDKGYELVFPAPGQTPSEDALLSSVPGCVGWLAGVEPIPALVLDQAEGLRVISRNGVGVNNIDLAAAERHGIAIERAAGTNARGVAELAIALMLAGFRHVPWSDAMLHQGRWKRRKGVEAEGRVLGIIGCGAIGQTVARIAIGLGMKVLGHDPYPPKGFSPEGYRQASLDEVFEMSDAITLHCPPSENPLIDASVIARLKSGVLIINTARAELLDDEAVLAGLESEKVSCLATDVFREEPPEPSNLLSHDRVIMTPHAGGFTEESVTRATETAVYNLLKVLEQ